MRRFIFLVLALSVAVSVTQAEPQYSVIMGQSCFLCHTDPEGRFMRSSYGSQVFAPQYLSAVKVPDSLLKRFNPQITPFLSVGADLRTIWTGENTQNKNAHAGLQAPLSTNTGAMAQMEGFIYFNLQASERVSVTGMQATDEAGGHFEVYGLASVLPLHGYVKAGLFQENFGWAYSDHTSFVRTAIFGGYDGTEISLHHPMTYGTGMELGVHPGMFDITASYANDAMIIPMARDAQKRWCARIQAQQGIANLGLQFIAGGDWMLAPAKAADPETSLVFIPKESRNMVWGGFGGIGWQGLQNTLGCKSGLGFLCTSLLFEYDRRAYTPINFSTGGDFPASTAAYSTGQASVMIQPGVWLTGAYDWLDAGYPVNGGKAQAERTSLGAQYFPLPWIEVSPHYRLQGLSGISDRNLRAFDLQIHFFL